MALQLQGLQGAYVSKQEKNPARNESVHPGQRTPVADARGNAPAQTGGPCGGGGTNPTPDWATTSEAQALHSFKAPGCRPPDVHLRATTRAPQHWHLHTPQSADTMTP